MLQPRMSRTPRLTPVPPCLFVSALLVTALLSALAAGPAAAQEDDPLPQRSNRPGLTPEEAAAPDPEPEDVAGRWYSEFGYMEIEVDGKNLSGTYSCCQGTFEGQLNAKRLELDWSDPIYGEGWAWLYWKPSGNLEGIFGKMEDMGIGGRWNAVRPPEPPAGGQRYTVEASHPRFEELDAEVILTLPDDPEERVEGLLRGHYDLTAREKPYRYIMLNQITGRRDGDRLELRWMDPVHLTRGAIELERGENGAWEGTWEPHFLRDESFPFILRPAPQH